MEGSRTSVAKLARPETALCTTLQGREVTIMKLGFVTIEHDVWKYPGLRCLQQGLRFV